MLNPPFPTAREGDLSGTDVTVYDVIVIVIAANKGCHSVNLYPMV